MGFLKLIVQVFFFSFFLMEGCRPRAQTQKKVGARRVGVPTGGRPKISHFFSLSLFLLSLGSFRGILVGFLKRLGGQMCTFEDLPKREERNKIVAGEGKKEQGKGGPGEGRSGEGRSGERAVQGH